MKTISLKLDERVDAQLTATAKRTGKTKSQVTREALVAFLEGKSRKAGVSCLDMVEDLVGTAKGPGDLASNRKYMRRYGR
jgi:Ribbon-helix-helix protein, copG family